MSDDQASLLESQNDSQLDSLHTKIRSIRHITTDLHDEVHTQNRLLDDMGTTMEGVQDKIKMATQRVKVMLSTPGGQQLCSM
ncbi:hypothetical protein HDV05_007605, partial [Chytridiales sp. JEL 0842]